MKEDEKMKKKCIAISVVLALLLQIIAPTAWGITEELSIDDTTEVVFADENLKAYLLEQHDTNGDGKLTPYEMAQITILQYSNWEETTDLQGLEYATNLQELELLLGNGIHLEVICSLENLETVFLQCTELENLEFARNLTNVKDLTIQFTRVSDIEPITHLTQLEYLDLSSNQIEDVTGIENLIHLKRLDLSWNKMKTVPKLDTLTELETIRLSDNHITDITVLEETEYEFNYRGLGQIIQLEPITMLLGEETEIALPPIFQTMYNPNSKFFDNTLNIQVYNNTQSNVTVRLNEDGTKLYVRCPEKLTKEETMEVWFEGDSALGGTKIELQYEIIAPGDTTQEISFGDEQLKQYILQQYDRDKDGKITPFDMLQIDELYYYDSTAEITNLQGLEYASNLKRLWIGNTAVTNVEVIKQLTNLQELLIQLPRKEMKDENGNVIYDEQGNVTFIYEEDVGFLGTLSQLERLEIGYADLSNVTLPPTLKSIQTEACKLGNLEILIPNYTNLNSVCFCNAGNKEQVDFSVLAKYANLQSITIQRYNIKNIDWLASLQNITDMNFRENAITDITILKELPNLQSADLSDNAISSIEILKEVKQLNYCYLSNNQIEDLTPIEGLENYYVYGQTIHKDIGDIYLGEQIEIELPRFFQQAVVDTTSTFYRDNIHIEVYIDNQPYINEGNDVITAKISEDKRNLLLTINQFPLDSNSGVRLQISGESPLEHSNCTIQFNVIARGNNTIEVTIPDQNFKQYLLENYDADGDGKITQYDMCQIHTMQIPYDKNITNIQGIEEAIHLRMLSLDNYLDSVQYITGLTNLEYLRMNCKSAEGIEQLANLTHLTSLSIYCSELTDISFVRNMPNLSSLGFGYGVEDITPLQGLTNLQSLYMYGNKITDIQVLETLPNLHYVALSGNQIEDVSILEDLTQNVYTGIYNQNLKRDLGTLTKGESIELDLPDLFKRILCQENSTFYMPEATVELEDNSGEVSKRIQVTLSTDKTKIILTPLRITDSYEMPICTLYLKNGGAFNGSTIQCSYKVKGSGDNTKVIHIPDPYLKAQLLNELDEDENGWISEYEIHQLVSTYIEEGVTNLEGLQYAENLERLEIYGSGQSVMPKGLEKLTKLCRVGIYNYGNTEWDISPVENLIHITYLGLGGNIKKENIDNVIQSLPNLSELYLNGIELEDISIQKMAKLERLTIMDTHMTAIPDVSSLNNLTYLDVSNNQIKDITAIQNLPLLETLYIANNQVEDIRAIKECPNLKWINISNNHIEDITPYLEAYPYSPSIGTQTITKTITGSITLGENGYTVELPQVAKYMLQEVKGIAEGKGDVVFTLAEDKNSIQLLQGTVGPKIVIEFKKEEMYHYDKVILTIEATITDQTTNIEEVEFADAEFKKEVVKQADINGDGKISVKEIQTLESLQIYNCPNITSIQGIEKATNLQYIEVIGSKIKDISPIVSLENLYGFNFTNNEITDISCLENAQFIDNVYDETISLTGNFIDFTEGNANYRAYYQLMHQWKDENGEDIPNLTFDRDIHAQNYGTVEERFKEVPMETALKNKLIEQGVDRNQDGKITRYELYSVGTEAYIRDNGGDALLSLANAGITNISGLEYLNTTVELDVSNNRITDITPITQCGNLRYLNLDNNSISSLKGIEKCFSLTTITVKNNKITDITPIGQLYFVTCDTSKYKMHMGYGIVDIDLSNNLITNIEPVKDFSNIGSLNLSGNTIQDITSLKNYHFLSETSEYLMIDLTNNYINTEAQGTKEAKAVFDQKGARLLLDNQKEKEDILKGDVNKDGKVALYDAFKILEVAILSSNISAEELKIMDYNEDGKVTLYDAFKFLEIAILS